MVDIAGPQAVLQSDRRSRVVALLVASDGTVLGNATVLSSDKAVTTAEVARSAWTKVEELDGAAPHPLGALMLTFPQFSGSPGLRPVPLEVQSIDESGFGVLNLLVSGQGPVANPIRLPYPHLSGFLGGTEIPQDGSTCDVLYNEQRQPNQFFLLRLSGRVGEPMPPMGLSFRLDIGSKISGAIQGAPVFQNDLIVGIIASDPNSAFDPGAFGPAFDTSPFVRVLSLAAMARSEVTAAVRNLLGRREAKPGKPRPSPTSTEITQINVPIKETPEPSDVRAAEEDPTTGVAEAKSSAALTLVPSAEGESAEADLSDDELFSRLTPSSRNALERALGMRHSKDQRIHMEHLIAGLHDRGGPTQRLLERAKIDRPALKRILQGITGTVIPERYEASPLTTLPPVSSHVRAALTSAAEVAGTKEPIRSRHLLYGVLSVEECRVAQELTKLGIRREDIVLSRGRNEDLGLYDPLAEVDADPAPEQPPIESTAANPTPRVDSDLWCQEDRLGYEAYARTIAGLITHKETKPPLTIGIKAPWGAGKTTLMKRVQHLLDGYAELSEGGGTETVQDLISQVTLQELLRALRGGPKPVKLSEKRSEQGQAYGLPQRITVWFNAWKYQTSEQIWAGMAHCIIAQVTARMDFKDRELFWLRLHARRISPDAVRRKIHLAIFKYALPYFVVCAIVAAGVLVLPVAWYYRFGATVLSLVPAALVSWRKYRDKASETVRDLVNEPDYEGRMGYLHLVESDIRKVLEVASASSRTDGNPNGDPLVIFVDDLDRCEPNKVAEVVQAINLFLCGDYPNSIFVLGMEPGMVAAALEVANKDVIEKAVEMGLVERTSLVGWRFMEKIVQLPIVIPPPTEAGARGYVDSLTGLATEAPDVTMFMAGLGPISPTVVPHSRPPRHGAEEETKVQSYIEKIGSAHGASEVAQRGIDLVAQAPVEERWAAQEAGNRVYGKALSERDPAMAEFARVVARLVNGNPRQIKRYVNVFRFYSTLRHSFRLEGAVRNENLPSDKMLAKFVALSIQWPHAVDCLRVMVEGAEGKKISLLKRLEMESKALPGDGATADEEWKKVVSGLKLPSWTAERAFREFLARDESLCEKEGHGLW